ncbi:MAG TPA: recombinase family protein [Bellilinea sp.]|nr:recombinase family protein [Bellilinea sp.]
MELNLPTNPDELKTKIQSFLGDLTRNPDQEVAAIYTRISRLDPRHHGYSLEIQPDRSEEYVKSKGWRVYAIYEDPAKTGRNSRRPGLQRMLQDVRAGRITVVVVHRLDRLYRNLESLLRFLKLIKRYKVRLVSVTEQIDTDNWWGRLVLYVLGALAEMYIWQASARTREAKLERVMRGLSNASYRFGYCTGLCSTCTDPNGKDYCPRFGQPDRPESERGRIPVPHPVESHAVRLIVNWYSQGKSDLDIASGLNRHIFRLPDGSETQFRTKGRPGSIPPGPFSRDNVRDIVRSPYYVGLVAHYPTRPLDMEDDPEDPRRKPNSLPLANKRIPQQLTEGVHTPLYSKALWEANMQMRKAKSNMKATTHTPRPEYLLTGIGRCWVCYEHGKIKAGFCGVRGGSGIAYYRCATVRDRGKITQTESVTEMITAGARPVEPNHPWERLLEAHTGNWKAQDVEERIDQMVGGLVIPEKWHDMIYAYYLYDTGLAEFERESYNLRKELERLQRLFTSGYLNQAQFEERAVDITRRLKEHQPANQSEIRELLPLLQDFKATWKLLSLPEKKALLKVIFVALYFDQNGTIRKAMVNNPFERFIHPVWQNTG